MVTLVSSISRDSYTLWLDHPITKALLQCLRDKRDSDNASFVKTVHLDAAQYVVERHLYKLAGQQQLIDKLIDHETLRDSILSKQIEWIKE